MTMPLWSGLCSSVSPVTGGAWGGMLRAPTWSYCCFDRFRRITCAGLGDRTDRPRGGASEANGCVGAI